MGRGGRGTHWAEAHPDRSMWTPEQEALARTMSQEAYEALYGRGEGQEKLHLLSPLLPTAPSPLLHRLQSGETLSSSERITLLSYMREGNISPGDPVLSALWESELRRTTHPWLEACSEGILEKIKDTWFASILPGMGRTSTRLGDPSVQNFLWWQNPREGEQWIRRGASSLLAAAMHSGVISRDELALILGDLQTPEERARFLEEDIFPEGEYFFSPQRAEVDGHPEPPEVAARAVWEAMEEYYGEVGEYNGEGDMARQSRELQNLLPDSEEFARQPIWQDDSIWQGDSIFREALHRFPWERALDRGQRDFRGVQREIFICQLLRIEYGGRGRGDQVSRWEAWVRGDSVPYPLESLRGIFAGQGEEELFEDLRSRISLSAIDGSLYLRREPLRDSLLDDLQHSSLEPGLPGLARNIEAALSRYLNV